MNQPRATTAILLARGLGSRMRRSDPAAVLDAAQQSVAESGLKAMIPDSVGRPFLAHILAGLADAGVARVVLVVAPDHATIRAYFDHHPPGRLELEYAVQVEALGTADAVLAARALVGNVPFLILNGDNLYPRAALEALVSLGEPGLIGFDPLTLLAEAQIGAERMRAFAIIAVDREGYLRGLIEKPDLATYRANPGAPVSMNLWRGDEAFFEACRRVPRSARGEFELPEALADALLGGLRIRVVQISAPVLDLSHPSDIRTVAALLERRTPPT